MARSTFSSFVSNCLLDDVIVLKENHGQKVVAECWRLRCTVPADGSDHLFKNSTHCVLGYPNLVHKFHFLFFLGYMKKHWSLYKKRKSSTELHLHGRWNDSLSVFNCSSVSKHLSYSSHEYLNIWESLMNHVCCFETLCKLSY